MARPGGVDGGVRPIGGRSYVWASAPIDVFIGNALVKIGRSRGNVSSTMTIDLLPFVNPLVIVLGTEGFTGYSLTSGRTDGCIV